MTCPSCSSTTIADVVDPKGVKMECLDCGFTWQRGGRRRKRDK